MALHPDGPAPYAPPQTMVHVIEAFRDRGLAVPFNAEVLIRGGVTESLASRTLQAFKLLDLVDDGGNPTETFEAIRRARGDDEYHARLQEWLRSVYADVLQYTDPAVDAPDRVAEAFRGFTPPGQRLRMVTLMIGLFEYSGLPIAAPSGDRSARPKAPRGPRTGRPGAPPKPRERPARAKAAGSTSSAPLESVKPGIPPGLLGLLREIPSSGESWTSSRRSTFLQAFTAVLDFSVPIDDSIPTIPEAWQLDEDDGSEEVIDA